MKNWPPCLGLWFPCGRSEYFATSGRLHVGHWPGSSSLTFECSLHVNDRALTTRTSSRRQILHVPGTSSVTSTWIGQLHTRSSFTGTSVILQIGHLPRSLSTTSACIGQVQEVGGSGRRGTASSASTADRKSRRPAELTEWRGMDRCAAKVRPFIPVRQIWSDHSPCATPAGVAH